MPHPVHMYILPMYCSINAEHAMFSMSH